jgi:hypothetical protein
LERRHKTIQNNQKHNRTIEKLNLAKHGLKRG